MKKSKPAKSEPIKSGTLSSKHSEDIDNNALERRSFLKGAAAGAAALMTGPNLKAAPSETTTKAKSATPPSSTLLAKEGGPSSVKADSRFIENPASDFMVDVVKSLGVEYIATNPGSSFESFHESLINYGNNEMPEMLTCLHEESAVGMAHGYAKIEGKPMMALLHGTVGLMHASMAIFNAYADRVPVYIIVGNHIDPTGLVSPFHSAQDMGLLVRDYVKWDYDITRIESFAKNALRAYKLAMTAPMGPVAIMIDHEMQGKPLDDKSSLSIPNLSLASPPQGDRNALKEAAEILVSAERPFILAQRSARTPAGIDWLVQLAELIEAPVQNGDWINEKMNFPWTHPLYGSGGANYKPDAVLMLELNDVYRHMQRAKQNNAKTINISSLQLHHGTNILDYGGYSEADLNIAADAEASMPALIEEVQSLLTRNRRKAIRERGEKVRENIAKQRRQDIENARFGWNASPISTARLSAELWAQIKNDDWSLVSWQGFISGWPGKLWEMEKHYHYIGGQGGGGIGYNAQAAVGAALANKKHGRLSINIQGDGDLNYAPGILWTAVHHKIPLLTIMHNNRAYHAEVMYVQKNCNLHKRGEDRAHIGTAITNPNIDYAAMARSYGMHGIGPIENPNDLGPAIKAALERVRAGEPALIDVVCQPR